MAVHPIATEEYRTPAARRGHPPRQEVEERHPLGRLLHWFEGQAFGGSTQAVRFYAVHDKERVLDRGCDRLVTQALDRSRTTADGCPTCAANVTDLHAFVRMDQLRDMADRAGRASVDSMHSTFKAIAGQVERQCTALVKRLSGRYHGNLEAQP